MDAIISDPPFGIREKAYGHCNNQLQLQLELQPSVTAQMSPQNITNNENQLVNMSIPSLVLSSSAHNIHTPSQVSTMGDCKLAVATLFLIAKTHLKSGGKLVFWLPTMAYLSETELRLLLQDIEIYTHDSELYKYLKFIRTTEQNMHSKLSRWLCVYERTEYI